MSAGQVVCLSGELGAGKTTLAKAIAFGLGVLETVTSPTYTLLNTYEGRFAVAHFDLYRLSGPEEFASIGGWETLESGAVCLVEWPQRLGPELPSLRWDLVLEITPFGRKLWVSNTFEGVTP